VSTAASWSKNSVSRPHVIWQDEKQLRGLHRLPPWQAEEALRAVQRLPSWQAEAQMRRLRETPM
jgi:hypothetical protein